MTTSKSQNYLLKLATGSGVCMSAFLLTPEPVDANICSLDNPLSINVMGCYKTPDRYVVKILEMGLCTSNPLSGTNFEGSTCTPTYTNADGVEIDVAAGAATLTGGTSTRPASDIYPHAYVKMANTFGLKGSYQLNSNTYCSKSDGTADATPGCTAQNFTETLRSFSGRCSNPYNTDDAKASEVLTEGTMSARLTNSSYVTATDCDATHLVGALALTNSVVIDDSTAGLEVQFTVSNSGMTIIPTNNNGNVVGQFAGGPFQAVFSLY